jgi:FixJ family two-component response regulator
VAGRFPGKSLAGFLKKPYQPAELTETIQRAIERRVVG